MRQGSLPTNSVQDIMAWVRSLVASPPYSPCYASTELPDAAEYFHNNGTHQIFIRDTSKPAWATASGWVYADGTSV